MLDPKNRVFNNLHGQHGVGFKEAQKLGDFVKLDEILKKGPAQIIADMKASGLKGRGGAGFSTGDKWSFINPADTRTKYLVINGDEGEPGTCKDRELIRHEPYKIVEGCIIGAFAIGAKSCYIYIRGEFYYETQKLQKAIDDAYANGFLGENCFNGLYSLNIYIHMGAGAYICGEESALLESLEGKKGFPRIKPPFPANVGLYGCPTIINNIETIATVSTILRRGPAWYSSLGAGASGMGTKLFAISGFVNNPCVVEEELGVPLKDLIEKHAGGVIGGWDNLFGVLPGGSSSPVIPKKYCDSLTMDFEAVKQLNSMLGTGAVIVLNKSISIIDVLENLIAFYHEESCGQCTPCREGSGAVLKLTQKIVNKTATIEEVEVLHNTLNKTAGTTICALNDATVMCATGFLRHYKDEIKEALLKN